MKSLRVAGFGESGRLDVLGLKSSCGAIRDGVAVAHPEKRCEGSWVIDYHDLERLYLEAKAARAEEPTP